MIGKFLVGAAVAIWIGVQARDLISAAWVACFEPEAGSNFGLNVFFFPIASVLAGCAMTVALFVPGRAPFLLRLVMGFGVAVVLGLAVFAMAVPSGRPEGRTPSNLWPECGPQGIPTWWPIWLPS